MEPADTASNPDTEFPPKKRAKKARGANFDHKDMEVLIKLVATIDPQRVVTSSGKDAGTMAKKKDLWDKIRNSFNMQSEREHPATKEQLHGLLKRAKMKAREDEDKKAQAKFKKICGQTGGGPGAQPPPQTDPDDDDKESANLTKLEDKGTNNVVRVNLTRSYTYVPTYFNLQTPSKSYRTIRLLLRLRTTWAPSPSPTSWPRLEIYT